MSDVLIVAHDPMGAQMAGPAIRTLELARALGKHLNVTLATPNPVRGEGLPFDCVQYLPGTLERLAGEFRVVVVFGYLLEKFPFLKKIPGSLVVDIYCPIFFEALFSYDHKGIEAQSYLCHTLIDTFNRQLKAGDYFICASERQRDMWMGLLMANGRLNPYTFRHDRSLRSLIDVVPYGLPGEPPVSSGPVLKGVVPGIEKGDKVLLWCGGIYDWLDPLVLLQAMKLIEDQRPDIKVFFMAIAHPLPDVEMGIIDKTLQLSEKLGLTGKTVFFNDQWIPYNQRANYLLESDIGLCLHPRSIETDYSFRTRIMDYIWCGLPILATEGGCLSDLVEEKALGRTVPYNNPESLSEAIVQMVSDGAGLQSIQNNMQQLQPELSWDRRVEPLVKFCQSPHRKVDAEFPIAEILVRSPVYHFTRLRHMIKHEGFEQVARTFAVKLLRLLRIPQSVIERLKVFFPRVGRKPAGADSKNPSTPDVIR